MVNVLFTRMEDRWKKQQVLIYIPLYTLVQGSLIKVERGLVTEISIQQRSEPHNVLKCTQ